MNEQILKVTELKEKYEYIKKQYDNSRKEMLEIMEERGITRYENPHYSFTIHRANEIDDDAMLENYPEIYYAGLECKFNLYKARKKFPPRIVNQAILECGRKGSKHVKVQFKSRRGQTIQTRRLNFDTQEDEGRKNASRSLRENRLFGYRGHYGRVKPNRVQRDKIIHRKKSNGRFRKIKTI
ncbi:MAG: hypothetical protein ACOCWM_05740 [Cyclobacteriaceae bacterium]